MDSRKKTLVALSGGIDSVTLVYDLIKKHKKIHGYYLNFDYPVSKKEIRVIKILSSQLHFPIEIINLKGIGNILQNYTPLFDGLGDNDQLFTNLSFDSISSKQSNFYIILLLLSTASFFSHIIGADRLFVGAIKDQFDKTEYLSKLISEFEVIISSLNPKKESFKIDSPFKNLTKSEVISLAFSLNVPFELTWSCMRGGKYHCGLCSQCKLRKKLLMDYNDKTIYEN